MHKIKHQRTELDRPCNIYFFLLSSAASRTLGLWNKPPGTPFVSPFNAFSRVYYVDKTADIREAMSTPPSVPHNAGTAPSLPTGASTADDAAARAAAAVEQCCALLSGKDDTQKFTGLLLLTKHVPVPSTDTPEGAALRSRLLEAMGTKFLKRLLKMGARARKRAAATVGTASGATTAASGAGGDGPMYEGLALGVMALFCADKALAPGLAALLPLVLASIRSQDAVLQLGETPKLQAVRDAAACVSGILHAKCRIPVSVCSAHGAQ